MPNIKPCDVNIRKAKDSGSQAAFHGRTRPNREALRNRNPHYTDKQIEAYFAGFDERASTQEVQLIRQARQAGKQAAYIYYRREQKLSSIEDLIESRNYTKEQAIIFRAAFKERMLKYQGDPLPLEKRPQKDKSAGQEIKTFMQAVQKSRAEKLYTLAQVAVQALSQFEQAKGRYLIYNFRAFELYPANNPDKQAALKPTIAFKK